MAVIIPHIHLGGTSRDALLEQHVVAALALRHAITAVGETAPNGRDYLGPAAGRLGPAMDAHRERMRILQAMLCEINEIAEGIAS